VRPASNGWTIVACLADAEAKACLRRSDAGGAALRFVETFEEVGKVLLSLHGSVGAVIITPTDATGAHAAPFVERLVALWPSISFMAYCSIGFRHSHDLRTLGAAGVHGFFFRGIDAAGADIREMLRLADRERAADAVLRRISTFLPRRLRVLFEYSTEYFGGTRTIREVARLIGVSRRTLFRYCERERYPPPGEMLVWCRLFLAAYLLEDQGRTIESVALEIGLPSANALRNLLRYHADCTPTEVRRAGGLEWMTVTFHARLCEFRAQSLNG